VCNYSTKEPNLILIMSGEFVIESFSSYTCNKIKSWRPQIKYHLYVKTIVANGLIKQEMDFTEQETENIVPKWH